METELAFQSCRTMKELVGVARVRAYRYMCHHAIRDLTSGFPFQLELWRSDATSMTTEKQ